jgi:hypothetical protein
MALMFVDDVEFNIPRSPSWTLLLINNIARDR